MDNELTKLAIAALDDPIRDLIARCKAMLRGKERNVAELELGKMLRKQDALILKVMRAKR